MNAIVEYVEELIDLKRTATVKFRAVEGGVVTTKGRIIKIESFSGRDIIKTDAGLLIGIDQILAINGYRFQNIC